MKGMLRHHSTTQDFSQAYYLTRKTPASSRPKTMLVLLSFLHKSGAYMMTEYHPTVDAPNVYCIARQRNTRRYTFQALEDRLDGYMAYTVDALTVAMWAYRSAQSTESHDLVYVLTRCLQGNVFLDHEDDAGKASIFPATTANDGNYRIMFMGRQMDWTWL